MSELKVTPVQPKPEFDVMYFLEICGESRIEQELLERLETAWNDWTDRMFAFKLIPSTAKNDEGFLFLYLSEGVENAVEEAWQKSPQEGMAFHNLAITLVMSSAQNVIPELLDSCTPLPRPMGEVLDFFEAQGLEWNDQIGSINRQYAVYTPFPYRGGCEICMQSDTCPNSTLRGNA
ncbi:hypothetical protein GGQ74_000179 [Desulfobaculum xiamenense]|uniref:Uncharacterized protein n=1 Tax=Desulfobaculum xiamenense TaxID=995050 RepID=A0A846QPA5_9BACT|nr:hypothetical protein [Desulfobaculum xiamenense]NJB66539.1 hypothetical protein [Desulfobaculum xiamenense]